MGFAGSRWRGGWVLLVLGLAGLAESAQAAVPLRDADYPGTITLEVDASDLAHRLFRVHESIPVRPGSLTLYFPQWLPGNHAPRGAIDALSGLTIRAGERRLAWSRDPADVYAFRVEVPRGTQSIDIEFQFASPQNPDQGRVTMTPDIVGVQWEQVLLYPAGYAASRIPVSASLTVSTGFQVATSLDVASRDGDRIRFRTTSLEQLIDSPVFSGRYSRREDLDPGSTVPVHLNVFADSPDEIVISAEQLAIHRKLVQEAFRVFGSKPFERYEFLFATTNSFGGIGLEHRRSSENALRAGYFKNWDRTVTRRTLLAHEMSHAWNGKFVRPRDLWTPHYNTPMQNSLLWVYEGQTQFWGQILSARSGLWSEDITKGSLAAIAANLDTRRQGRAWRPLQDTTNQPIMTARRPLSWVSWQRTEDYYDEGLLLWLAVDARIREITADQRSIDDFTKAFFGNRPITPEPALYTFDDLVVSLNSVAPFDWSGWLRAQLDSTASGAPLEGFERLGWRLTFADKPTEYLEKLDEVNENTSLSYSLGVVVDKDARFTDVVWDSPAFKAGLNISTTLIAVNGRAFNPRLLKDAITTAKGGNQPIELLVRSGDRFQTIAIPYFDGLKYPVLERIEAAPDRLSALLKPRT